MSLFRRIAYITATLILGLCLRPAHAGDWPQWGGTREHNMVSSEKGLAASFRPGTIDSDTETMDLRTAENVKWVFKLGTESHGSPVIAQGRIFVGSNYVANQPRGKPKSHAAGGWLVCLDEKTGRLLWELVTPKLPESRAPHSDTGYGICSSPTIEGDRLYVVTNCADVLCLDIHGMANGNDGPFVDEGGYMAGNFNQPGVPTRPVEVKPTDADIVWRYDIFAELEAHPHDASSCSILIDGDYLYVCTGNGVNREENKVLNPLAPSLIVLDKRTGRLIAADDEKIGTRLYKGQWTSPSLCRVGGKTLIIYGGGDGLCYAFEPVAAPAPGQRGSLKKVWAVECNPPDCKFRDGRVVGYREKDGPSEIVGTPVCVGERIYVTIGRDPHRGPGKGCVTCIDAARGVALWSCDKIGRSMSTVSVADGLLYVAETFGAVHCLDAHTGQIYWSHKIDGHVWGSTMVADGKLYVPTSRHLLVFAPGKEKKLLASVKVDSPLLSTPTPANGVLYVATQEFLYAVAGSKKPVAATPAASRTASASPAADTLTGADEELTGAWPQWRGPARDGRVPHLPKNFPALPVLWKSKVAGPCDAGIAVAEPVLVLCDHDEHHDAYRCLQLADGKEVWKRAFPNGREMDYGAGPRATPLVYRDKVYAQSAFGEFFCFELKTGRTLWRKDFVKDFAVKKPPRWGYCSSPLVAHGRLIVNPGGKVSLAALEPETGSLLWQGEGGPANYSSFIACTFGGVAQVVGYDLKSLGGWDLASGKRLWTLDVDASGGFVVPTPLSLGDRLLVSDSNSQTQLFTFAEHGRLRIDPVARNEDLSPEVPTPVAARDMILGQSGRLVCLDAASLKTLWLEEQEKAFTHDCHLIVSEDRGLAFNSEGELVLFRFDRQGATILGKKKLCNKTLMHPTVAGSRLLVRDGEFLYCYGLGE